MPPASELVAIIPLIKIGTVQGIVTPVGGGTSPDAIAKYVIKVTTIGADDPWNKNERVHDDRQTENNRFIYVE